MIISPDNTMPIETLWAVMSKDDNGDGICAGFIPPMGMVPLVTGSPKVLALFEKIAREQLGGAKALRVVQFNRVSERGLSQ